MSYWGGYSKFNQPLVSTYKDTIKSKFIFVDGGAAGKLSEPFNIARPVLKVISFEPRGSEKVLKDNFDIFIQGGLWSHNVDKILNISKDPSTSSVYPPNYKFLKNFDDNYGAPKRNTVQKIKIKLKSLDSCVKKKKFPYLIL